MYTEEEKDNNHETMLTLLRLDHLGGKHVYPMRHCPLCGGRKFSDEVEEALRSDSGNYGYE